MQNLGNPFIPRFCWFYSFFFVCVCVCVCLYWCFVSMYVCMRYPRSGVTGSCKLWCVLGIEPVSSGEKPVLLTLNCRAISPVPLVLFVSNSLQLRFQKGSTHSLKWRLDLSCHWRQCKTWATIFIPLTLLVFPFSFPRDWQWQRQGSWWCPCIFNPYWTGL